MNHFFANHGVRAVLGVCLLAGLAGCSKKRTYADYMPSAPAARKALETALTAWQEGKPVGKITSVRPAVEVRDVVWEEGQKLGSFQIVKEEPGDGGPRWFSVELTMKDSPEKQVVRYMVVGRDPLWVCREGDPGFGM